MTKYLDSTKRHDAILLFDVTDGNPNGDPDAGNLPRVDPETMHGITTDVCLKRKVRNFVDIKHGELEFYKIYVQEGAVLNERHARAYLNNDNIKSSLKKDDKGVYKTDSPRREAIDQARAWMCANFYDIRMFGAVMSTGVNCGQVRGPVQITFARSIDPITPIDVSITRMAVTKEEERDKERTMGRKSIVPYGLYRAHIFFSPHLACDTGVQQNDLEIFWNALIHMWDVDHSAARGMMACRGLYIFSHEHALGNVPAHQLFQLLSVQRKNQVAPPRCFEDYAVQLLEDDVPQGVHLTKLHK